MKLIVISYNKERMAHHCIAIEPSDEDIPFYIDLGVNNGYPNGMNPEDLVGKVVSVSELQPFESIGTNVELVEVVNENR